MEGYTFVKKSKIIFEWKIPDASSFLIKESSENEILKSSDFTSGSKLDDLWRLELWLNNEHNLITEDFEEDLDLNNYLSISLCKLHDYNINTKYSFWILTDKQEKISFYSQFVDAENDSGEDWGVDEFVEKQKLLDNKAEFLPNDTLTIQVEIIIDDDALTIPVENLSNSSPSQLGQDLGNLYENKENCDITIIVGNTRFKAHKLILSVRSPVLAAAFTHDMIEKKSNEVSIPDIDPEIFEKVLRYIYTGQVSDQEVVAARLLEAADKYQLLSLKKLCEEALMRSSNRGNIVEIVALADRHSAQNLKDYAIKCIIADATNVMKTPEFGELERTNPSLALELLRKYTFSQINNTTVTYSN
ncbi:speckle-type POZ protein B-like [Cotesia glomerata]|uniref:speckle-type POZ protein B-like n=1 Tax=Cotesia glomerata TaxID=32391 RepID=UPI001D02F04E|nr:speckle-type POZ protein B-like [Cotesia glomerata]